jgi:hypothetical protein
LSSGLITKKCSVTINSISGKLSTPSTSRIATEHDYDLFKRNYFETSHAKSKGPQDAAGGFLKNPVDLAVYRGEKLIVFVIRANHEKVFCYDKQYIG